MEGADGLDNSCTPYLQCFCCMYPYNVPAAVGACPFQDPFMHEYELLRKTTGPCGMRAHRLNRKSMSQVHEATGVSWLT